MNSIQLTSGGVRQLLSGNSPPAGQPIRLQVLGLKILNQESGKRVKALLSDGHEAVSCVLSNKVSMLVTDNMIAEKAIVDVGSFLVSTLQQGKQVLIIADMHHVCPYQGNIGNPVTVSMKAMHETAQVAPASYGAPPQQGAYGAMPPQHQQQPPAYGGMPQQYQQQPPAYGGMPQQYQQQPPPAYGGMPQQYQQQQPPAYGGPSGQAPGMPYKPAGGGAIERHDTHANILPINALNSYQNRWTIKARVTAKSDIRRYSNARGEGKFFSFDLLDGQEGEIRVVGWNDQCDRFYNQVEEGRVYYLSKASLRNKRGNYNQTRHQFEIHLESNSQLELAEDEYDNGVKIKTTSFNFQKISDLEDAPQGAMVDIIGIAESITDISTITRKDGSEAMKRAVSIKDPSNRSIEVTLWGNFTSTPGEQIAAEIAASRHPVVAIKGGRVGEFNGKNISTVNSSQVLVDPQEPPETAQIKHWYATQGASMTAQPLSVAGGERRKDRRICMSQIRGEGLGLGGETAWVQAICYMVYSKNDRFMYPACTLQYNGKQCNKKVANTSGDETKPDPDGWYCERCNSKLMEPEYRYILNCQFGDYSDASWVTAFNETAPAILGTDAGQLVAWSRSDDQRDIGKFSGVFRDAQFKQFVVKFRISEEKYNEEDHLRVNVVRVEPISYKAETSWTLDAIRRLEQGQEAYPALTQHGQAQKPQSGYHHQAPAMPANQAHYGNPGHQFL